MPPNKAVIDDGFNPELVKGARFDGVFEIPCIEEPKMVIIPKGFTPFTKRHKAPTEHEALCFFEFDTKFTECLIAPELFVGTARAFDVFVPTDNSLYRDQPLATQIGNIYRSRAIGFYYQKRGANVYPLIRWGDERTYTDAVLPEPVAFAGAPRNSGRGECVWVHSWAGKQEAFPGRPGEHGGYAGTEPCPCAWVDAKSRFFACLTKI